jgi:hypothetical protein
VSYGKANTEMKSSRPKRVKRSSAQSKKIDGKTAKAEHAEFDKMDRKAGRSIRGMRPIKK